MGASKSNIRIVPYETIKGRICITPCMKKLNLDGERPFIGSLKCEMCTCFISKDQEKQEVTCNYSESANASFKWKSSIKKRMDLMNENKQRKMKALGSM